MIINTGSRTDIPAFYSEWFYRRIREGFVMVRNPYRPTDVTRYLLDPSVADMIAFCTKNPAPMLGRLHELDAFRTFFMVTITPYGKDIEPYVPEPDRVMDAFAALSEYAGRNAVSWRYDPVLITDRYPVDFHKSAFEKMAGKLKNWTDQCVVSFVDLYEKTKRNFPGVRNVTQSEQRELIRSFGETAERLRKALEKSGDRFELVYTRSLEGRGLLLACRRAANEGRKQAKVRRARALESGR